MRTELDYSNNYRVGQLLPHQADELHRMAVANDKGVTHRDESTGQPLKTRRILKHEEDLRIIANRASVFTQLPGRR